MDYLIAIDSGGTKCDTLLADAEGRLIRKGHHQLPGVGGRVPQAMLDAIKQVLSPLPKDLSCLHVICIPSATIPTSSFMQAGGADLRLHFVSEDQAPMALTGHTVGAVVLAGTGAMVHFVTRDGRRLRYDGLGPLLGDYGSGYHIGQLGLKAAMKSPWHLRHKTSLEHALLPLFNVKNLNQLVALNFRNPDRSEIAAVATVVDREAEAGDAISREVLQEAASHLFETLRDCTEALGLGSEEYPLVGTGGVIRCSGLFWKHFCSLVRKHTPHLNPVLSPLPAVAGMILAAAQRLSPGNGRIRENLFATAADIFPEEKKKATP